MSSGDILGGRYEIERALGEGGMGKVYLAEDRSLSKKVAIKTLLPSMLSDRRATDQLKNEVRTAQQLRHPSICAIFDFQEAGGVPFVVMEYIDGDLLSNHIYAQPGHRCSEVEFRRLAGLMLDAMGHAHRAGVVHRDIKSANIMVTKAGEIRVMDFGIAASLKETYSRTTGSSVSLSIHYASPEQINGARPSPLMDIYSLGCVFYEMLSGEPPFTQGDILHQQLTRRPEPIGGVSGGLNELLRRCLEKEAGRRPESAGEIQQLLAGLADTTVRVELKAALDKTVRMEGGVETAAPPWPAVEGPQEGVRQAYPAAPMLTVEAKRSMNWKLVAVLGMIAVLSLVGVGILRELSGTSQGRVSAEFSTAPREPVVEQPASRVSAQVTAGATRRNPADGLTYVRIPAGRFQMGCSLGDGECDADEKPAVMVEISKGFWMGQTEVPQGAHERVMGSNPSQFKGSDRPVESVTWEEASAYCAKVGGRLPTEAEWERAARGGTSDARYGALDRIGWYNGNSGSQTQRVGGKEANRYGLHDMLGNVWEWTGDWYQEKLPGGTDPRGPATGNQRVLRGGSWYLDPRFLRASDRGGVEPSIRYGSGGFRCVW